jgi:hypothetical protein
MLAEKKNHDGMTGINGMPPTTKNFSRARAYAVNYMPIMPIMPPYPPKKFNPNILGFFLDFFVIKIIRRAIKKYSAAIWSALPPCGWGICGARQLRWGRRLENIIAQSRRSGQWETSSNFPCPSIVSMGWSWDKPAFFHQLLRQVRDHFFVSDEGGA